MSSLAPQITVTIIDEMGAHGEQLMQLLGRESELSVRLGPSDIDEAIKSIRRAPPDITLLSVQDANLLDVVRRLDTAAPTTAIILLLNGEQESLARECLLAGARAYITHIYSRSDLVETIFRIHDMDSRRRQLLTQGGTVQAPQVGRILAVHGAKGGVGSTTIAVNLAVALRSITAGRVALVDGNLYSGDIAVSLNIISRNSISDLLPHLRDLDKELLDSASVVHRSGISVLLAPDELELADAVTGEAMQRILKSMRTYFDYIVVDTCSLPDQVTMAALDNADTILLIATPELPSLKNAARFIRTCREHGYPADKLMLVINRENSRNAISRADIEENLKLKVGLGIRSDGRTLIRAINAGEPAVSIDRRSRIGRGIRQLATIIATGQVARVSGAASPTARVSRGPLAWIARRST